MVLTLISINIEGSKHLDRVIAILKKEKPDIICLQEVFKKDLPRIKKELNIKGAFFPLHTITKKNAYSSQLYGPQGICYLTNIKHTGIRCFYYVGHGTMPVFKDPYSHDRALIYSVIKHKGAQYTIGTTHFAWSADGRPNRFQKVAFSTLMGFLQQFDSFVLCGDFNAPRGGILFSKFKEYFNDNLPPSVKTTLDPHFHKKKKLKIVIDTIFSTNDYDVSRVRAVHGVSDHKALVATINKKR